jgi:hypothetical protein
MTETETGKKWQYKSVPLDEEGYQMLLALCEAYELNKRSQGAMMKKLIKAAYQQLADVKLISPLANLELPGNNERSQ